MKNCCTLECFISTLISGTSRSETIYGLQAGAQAVFGLSVQPTDYQREASQRLHLPYVLLSDAGGEFAMALRLPTFEVSGQGQLIKRLTLIICNGMVLKCFYPVFPSSINAAQVKAWLTSHQ